MADWMNRIRALLRRGLTGVSERLLVLVAVAAIASGLTLGFVSVIPDIDPAGSTTLSGTLPPFSERNESFRVDTGLTELRLVNGACSVFATVLSEAELEDFLATGSRPEPHLDCDRRVATFQYALRWIILENRGSSDAAYEISAQFFSVRSPWALLAIPALPLVLGGTLSLVLRGLRRGIAQLQEQRQNESEKR